MAGIILVLCLFTVFKGFVIPNVYGSGLTSMIIWRASEKVCNTRNSGYYYDFTKSALTSNLSHRFRRNTDSKSIVVKSLHTKSNIVTRFGETVVSSTMMNPHSINIDTSFSVQIPEAAFISNYTMVIDGDMYVAEVKSKEEAKMLFDQARDENKTAGMVSAQQPEPEVANRNMQIFAVKVTVKASSSVSFQLTYLESLVRKLGVFEYRVSVRPKQIVEELTANITLHEPQGIKQLDVFEPSLDSNSVVNLHTHINDLGSNLKEINFTPDIQYQESFSRDHGVSGDFVVRYDVSHPFDVGSVQMDDSYFVHHFSPDENQLNVLSKNLIFVIDVSGSMGGDKIKQTREAMLAMLDWLNLGDRFMIILFQSFNEFWPLSRVLVPATLENKLRAKNYVKEKVVAGGGTNINDALVTAATRLSELVVEGGNIILFLTDGRPSSGETLSERIISNVVKAAAGRVSVFSLGFGFDLNYELLERISYRTEGYTVRIYEESDAVKQLTDFFLQINNPLLFNIEFNYLPQNVIVVKDGITMTSFGNYFKGSELTVAGKLQKNVPEQWQVQVAAKAGSDQFLMSKNISTQNVESIYSQNFIEKLYFYLKIKDLLREELTIDNVTKKFQIKQRALDMALKNNLVTPLTSMIIVQETKPQLANDEFDAYSGIMAAYPKSTSIYSSGESTVSVWSNIFMCVVVFFALLM